MSGDRVRELESENARLTAQLRMAEFRQQYAEVGVGDRDRRLAEVFEAYEQLRVAYDRVWRDYVPDDVKAHLEREERRRREESKRESERLLKILEGERESGQS